MARTDRSAERFKYGICLNDECQECKKKTIQQVPMRKDLLCVECGKPLRECPPPVKTPWKKYLGIGIPVLVVVAFVIWFAFLRDSGSATTEKPGNIVAAPDTTIVDGVKKDSTKVDKATTSNKEKPKPQPITGNGKSNLSFGTYDGPMTNGKPDGFGGTITVTSTYTIDLKKASGETVTVNRGDKIMNVKMENGRLRQGEIHFADGTRKYISGL